MMLPRFLSMVIALVLVSTASAAGAETLHVTAGDIAFTPQKITAHVGDRIEWDNKDFVAHSATAKTGDSWDIQLAPGKTDGVTLTKTGHIDYYCKFHPNMTGEIDVK